ncbi:MAG: Fic family protein [Planctomycetes bacterium]|nr:Fic family protein [Planctomycetota bacterium]
MREEDFSSSSPGRLVEVSGGKAFVPSALPRRQSNPHDVTRLVGRANKALGALEAGIAALPSPELFVGPFRTQEAVLSSRIEGTVTTLDEAFVHNVTPAEEQRHDDDARSVQRYHAALMLGIGMLKAGHPLGESLIRAMHAELLKEDPRAAAFVGKFRTGQVAIGPPGAEKDLKLARFVPPPATFVQDCIDGLIAYCNDRESDDPLVRIALMHYQFETIHPFLDGNGRVGRILIPLQMVHEGVMQEPWFYLSSELERQKGEYTAAMYEVSSRGDYSTWTRFFLSVVLRAADGMLAKIQKLRELHREYRQRLKGRGEIPMQAVETIFRFPAFLVTTIATDLECSDAAARKTALELEACHIVKKLDDPLRHGKRGRPPAVYLCEDISRIMREVPAPAQHPEQS